MKWPLDFIKYPLILNNLKFLIVVKQFARYGEITQPQRRRKYAPPTQQDSQTQQIYIIPKSTATTTPSASQPLITPNFIEETTEITTNKNLNIDNGLIKARADKYPIYFDNYI